MQTFHVLKNTLMACIEYCLCILSWIVSLICTEVLTYKSPSLIDIIDQRKIPAYNRISFKILIFKFNCTHPFIRLMLQLLRIWHPEELKGFSSFILSFLFSRPTLAIFQRLWSPFGISIQARASSCCCLFNPQNIFNYTPHLSHGCLLAWFPLPHTLYHDQSLTSHSLMLQSLTQIWVLWLRFMIFCFESLDMVRRT